MRADYRSINPDIFRTLATARKQVGSIESDLRALVEVRVSQINGCAYCVDSHSNEARQAGVSQQRLDCLCVWEESELFDERECAALAWAEVLTDVANSGAPDEYYDALAEYFSEEEIVDLTMIVSMMNLWNRIGVGFAKRPVYRE